MKETSLPPADGGSPVARLRRVAPLPPRRLTTRETEILGFLATGLGTSAIARELSISPATVRNHAQRILAKLEVHSRLAAVARGYATGLLPSPQWRTPPPSVPEPPPV
jgi:DNA-binding NarL/FixJ family response regulator